MAVFDQKTKKNRVSPLGGKREPSQRQLRVAQVLRQALSDILLRGDDLNPDFPWREVIVTEIVVSADLKLATLYVRHLFPDYTSSLLGAFEAEKKRLKHLLAPRLGLRYMPDLRVRLDTTFDQALRMEVLLSSPEVQRDVLAHLDSKKEEES